MFVSPLTATAELRPLEPWQSTEYAEHMDRARDHITPWVGQSFITKDVDDARTVLQRYADRRAADTGGIWGIWLEDRLVGGVLLVSFDADSGVCEAGCWLEPGAQGRGLITRATEQLLDWAILTRGIHRVEWHTKAGNVRSIAVAGRLGMRRDSVPHPAQPDPAISDRSDVEVYFILAPEWRTRRAGLNQDKAEIDQLATAFFQLFTNAGDAVPNIAAIHELFVPEGIIIQGRPGRVIYDLDGFATPRQRLLSSSELTGFSEQETWERTQIFGDVAHRVSRYRKQGLHLGEPFTGTGTKIMHFLRTPDGWRMTALSWDDDPSPTR